jgi:hypothetical protein
MRRLVVTGEQGGFPALQALHPSSKLLREGGKPVVLLPGFSFTAAGAEQRMDLLLHPSQHSGYVTRLFFDRVIEGRGANWTAHRVIDRQWWAPSWKDVPEAMAWPAMLCAHLRAVV